MKNEQIYTWAPHEWEVAFAYYVTTHSDHFSLTAMDRAQCVQAHWRRNHFKDPGEDYIIFRLRYAVRPQDFEWVALLFSEAHNYLVPTMLPRV